MPIAVAAVMRFCPSRANIIDGLDDEVLPEVTEDGPTEEVEAE